MLSLCSPPSLSDQLQEHEKWDTGGARRFCLGAGGCGAWKGCCKSVNKGSLCCCCRWVNWILGRFGSSLQVKRDHPSVLYFSAEMWFLGELSVVTSSVFAQCGAALSRHLRWDKVRIKSEIEIRLAFTVGVGWEWKYASLFALGYLQPNVGAWWCCGKTFTTQHRGQTRANSRKLIQCDGNKSSGTEN